LEAASGDSLAGEKLGKGFKTASMFHAVYSQRELAQIRVRLGEIAWHFFDQFSFLHWRMVIPILRGLT
jgi:hypothetical protein